MYIDDVIWLPDIAEKIAVKHNVTEEAEITGGRFRNLPQV